MWNMADYLYNASAMERPRYIMGKYGEWGALDKIKRFALTPGVAVWGVWEYTPRFELHIDGGPGKWRQFPRFSRAAAGGI